MADWVLKGSLKGPQGDPGQDAQLPAGGTEGQVLTKTADGEAWQDVSKPDMAGFAKLEKGNIYSDTDNILTMVGEDGQKQYASSLTVVPSDYVSGTSSESVAFIGMTPSGSPTVDVRGRLASVSVRGNGCYFELGDKFITGIYDFMSVDEESLITGKGIAEYVDSMRPNIADSISDTPKGDALPTDKAVADYVAEHSVTTPVPIDKGGTGATTADGARTALGISVADPDELVEYVKQQLG